MSTIDPLFVPNERVYPADMDGAAALVRQTDRAVFLARYPNQNTATSASPRFRARVAEARTDDGRALTITARKVDGVVGVFCYLTGDQLDNLVNFYDYVGTDARTTGVN